MLFFLLKHCFIFWNVKKKKSETAKLINFANKNIYISKNHQVKKKKAVSVIVIPLKRYPSLAVTLQLVWHLNASNLNYWIKHAPPFLLHHLLHPFESRTRFCRSQDDPARAESPAPFHALAGETRDKAWVLKSSVLVRGTTDEEMIKQNRWGKRSHLDFVRISNDAQWFVHVWPLRSVLNQNHLHTSSLLKHKHVNTSIRVDVLKGVNGPKKRIYGQTRMIRPSLIWAHKYRRRTSWRFHLMLYAISQNAQKEVNGNATINHTH